MAKRVLRSLALAALSLAAVTATDECTAVDERFNTCDVQSICEACIVVSGCYYSLSDQRCALTITSATQNATTYCDASDAACSTCSVSDAQPTCSGTDNCICPSVCSAVSASSKEGCNSSSSSRLLFGCGLTAFSVLFMLYTQRKMGERLARHAYLMRQRPGRPLRPREPRDPTLVPSLDGWRQNVEQHKLELADVELASCCYVKMDDTSSRHTTETDMSSSLSMSGPEPEPAPAEDIETMNSSEEASRQAGSDPQQVESRLTTANTATSTSLTSASASAASPSAPSSTQTSVTSAYDQRGAVWLVTL